MPNKKPSKLHDSLKNASVAGTKGDINLFDRFSIHLYIHMFSLQFGFLIHLSLLLFIDIQKIVFKHEGHEVHEEKI